MRRYSRFGDPEHPPHASRDQHVEVAAPGLVRVENGVRVSDDEVLVRLPVGRRREDGLLVSRWQKLARLSVLGQEVLAHPSKRLLNRGRIDVSVRRERSLELPKLAQQQAERRVKRTRLEEAIETAAHRLEYREQRSGSAPRGIADREITRPGRQIPAENAGRHDPAIEQAGQPLARTAIAKLCEHERDVFVLPGDAPARTQRPIERLVNEPRHLGFVGHLETGVQIGFERKFAQQRQAERVDRADRHVGRPVAQLTPATRRKLAARPSRAKRRDDALAHLGCGFPRKRERQNLGGVYTLAQQVDVAIDEHARLARAGRRLECHVVARIDGPLATGPIAGIDPRFRRHRLLFVEGQEPLNHARSPSGTRRSTRSSRKSSRREAAAGIRRRSRRPRCDAAACARPRAPFPSRRLRL